MFLQLALVMYGACWSLRKTEPSRQVWEPEGRGWPTWSAVLQPLPDGALCISLLLRGKNAQRMHLTISTDAEFHLPVAQVHFSRLFREEPGEVSL